MDTGEECDAVVASDKCLAGGAEKHVRQENVGDGVMPTASADEKSVEAPKPPPSLDTLPLEIKNQIFSYFLLGKNVKTPVPGPHPKFKYHFETRILRANKKLAHAAKSYLYGYNNFAVVSLPQTVEDFFAIYNHPVVSRHHVQAIKHHTIRAHLETRHIMGRAAAKLESQASVPSAKPGKISGVLMLLEDLIPFCDSLQLCNHVARGDHIFIISQPSAKRVKYQVGDIPNLTKTRIFVQLRQTPYLPLKLSSEQELERQKRLLQPFQSLANNIHKVIVKGADGKLSNLLVERLSSRLSWPDAMGWNFFELMLRHADRMAGLRKSGHWDDSWFAVDLETTADSASMDNQLMTASRAGTTLYAKSMPEKPADRAVSWHLGIRVFAIECYLATAAFYAKKRDCKCFQRVAFKTFTLVASFPLTQPFLPFDVVRLVHHCYVLAVALTGTIPYCIKAVDLAVGLAKLHEEVHHAEESGANMEHDLNLLREYIRTELSATHSLSVIHI